MPDSLRTDLKNLTLAALEQFLQGQGKERYRATQIFKWLYQHDVSSFEEMTNVSKALRAELARTACISRLEPETVEVGTDGTRKYLFMLEDGNAVESVIIPDEDRNTLCISSQAGCAMQCAFCLTGTFSLTRNLTTAEIVNQILAVRRDVEVRNIVMMGMGEPLHNLDNVIPALQIMAEDNGLQLSSRRVTVSTCGLVPELERLGREVTVNLAVSLNATTDELRDRIMPVNKAYPIATLLAALKNYPLPGRRKITIEYVLLGGLNDTPEDAKRLVRLLSDIPCKINLIPFNPHEGADFRPPTRAALDAFHKYLLDRHFTVITRDSRGSDISAACGQLKGKLDRKPSQESSDV
ncbi:23S rRNA (adenine(2503)-C(2))-methyltransferase RlmN [Trichlorobacter lovleyi]|uniref:23S rRNA (adenine(2503)-C(2))-methyltransferase RlmN n=1 Tax=Trichlorobacter lovleyi TaxID=313985 RepID=UPI00223EF50D|nr:23S rRNA (adenine(2503)-C(2))-methyltransferase RlmN [Trichlorobacter lovleyi]QOX80571.1 23S rRNA (adenine(2503)-C(2))-methyltransferase RlmN [Trichlorobacter lovleyi]